MEEHAPDLLAMLVDEVERLRLAVERFAAFARHASTNAPVIDRAEAEIAWLRERGLARAKGATS